MRSRCRWRFKFEFALGAGKRSEFGAANAAYGWATASPRLFWFRADEWLLGVMARRSFGASRWGPGPVTTSFSPPWLTVRSE